VDTALCDRIEEHVRRLDLIPAGGEVTCLVSGGADSTCLWHALRTLGYTVSAVHVDHGLRGEESDEDARFCRETMGARVIRVSGSEPLATREAQLRDVRYAVTAGLGLRATGHTQSDQVETVLYHLVSRGHGKGIEPRRADGVVRPLLPLTREKTRAYCRAESLPFREDSSNPDTKRGLIRDRILPLLRELHPAAEENLLRLLDPRETLSPELADLLASPVGSKRVDLGGGVQAVREYDRLWLEHGPTPLRGRVRWGEWVIRSQLPNLHVRSWRAGDRLAGRRRKVQDVFVDAKVPRSERESWPLVVRGDEVVAIPGLVEADGVTAERA
jgi:tRNA(Ile)-lysidine synthetase-like protein